MWSGLCRCVVNSYVIIVIILAPVDRSTSSSSNSQYAYLVFVLTVKTIVALQDILVFIWNKQGSFFLTPLFHFPPFSPSLSLPDWNMSSLLCWTHGFVMWALRSVTETKTSLCRSWERPFKPTLKIILACVRLVTKCKLWHKDVCLLSLQIRTCFPQSFCSLAVKRSIWTGHILIASTKEVLFPAAFVFYLSVCHKLL